MHDLWVHGTLMLAGSSLTVALLGAITLDKPRMQRVLRPLAIELLAFLVLDIAFGLGLLIWTFR